MIFTSVRIVSLLPSATEIVCSLGLEEQLVGVTHECDYPRSVRALPKVTRTLIPHDATSAEIDRLVVERTRDRRALYTLDLPTLEALRPDVIVTQALCDVCAVAEGEVQAAACSLPGRPRVVNLEPTSLDEVLACIAQVAAAVGVEEHRRDEERERQLGVERHLRRSRDEGERAAGDGEQRGVGRLDASGQRGQGRAAEQEGPHELEDRHG